MNMNRSKPKRKEETNEKETVTLRDRIERFFLKWERYRGFPTLIMALLSVALYLTARTYYGGNDKTVQLKFVENLPEPTRLSETTEAETSKPLLSGEGYETAMRLREAGALLMAASLSSFEEFRNHGEFPATSGQILSDLQKRGLLPPGIELGDGIFHSSLSDLKINYRRDPFTLEILSLPAANIRGPAFLLRIPTPVGEPNSITYFRSPIGTNFPSPAPFISAEQLVSAGWSITHWRGESLLLDDVAVRDLHEQGAWLKSRDQRSR